MLHVFDNCVLPSHGLPLGCLKWTQRMLNPFPSVMRDLVSEHRSRHINETGRWHDGCIHPLSDGRITQAGKKGSVRRVFVMG